MSNTRIISKHDKRISLRCPCSISASSLEQDKTDGKYSIKLAIENEGDSGVANDTVKNASLVIRCTDSNGNSVRFDDNDYLVKTVNFGDEGLERSHEITMAVMLGSFGSSEITDFEVYVSRIRFADGAVLDYLRADFFPVPAKPVPLIKKLGEDGEIDAKTTFGESAEYIPEKLSEVVWRCTCGEICESPRCPMCSCEREEVFAYFGVSAVPVSVGAAADPEEKGKKLRAAIVGILSASAIILLIILLILLLSKCDGSSGNGPDSDSNTTTTNNGVTDPQGDAKARAEAYANADLYDAALDVCKESRLDSAFTDSIRKKAAEYYASSSDYVKAYSYASQVNGYENLEALASGAYTQCMSAKDYEGAIGFANALGDAAKKTEAVTAMANELIASGDYLGAYNAAINNVETSLADQIASNGIEVLTSSRKYDDAIDLAKATGNDDELSRINAEAAGYYIDSGDFNSAAKYAAASGDPEVLEELCSKLDDDALRMNLPSYFDYLTPSRLRTVLASSVGGGRLPAIVTPAGTVLYGMGQTYSAPAGTAAVSVASGGSHTVILHANGQVAAIGDNTYGQCAISSVTGAIAISAGNGHTVILLSDGTVKAFGDNAYGQCNVSSFKDVVAISAGDTFTLALTKNGKVLCTSGDIDTSSLSDVVAISAGRIHALALTADGEVISVGSPLLGMGATEDWQDVVRISASSTYSLGLTSSGELLFTGAVIGSQIGSGELASLTGACEISASEGYILAYYEDGSVKAIGPHAPDLDWMKTSDEENNGEINDNEE